MLNASCQAPLIKLLKREASKKITLPLLFIYLFNREVLSYSIAKQPSAQFIMTTLNQSIDITSDCLFRRPFHSDQGRAYQKHPYTDKLKEHRIFQSMSRKGNCHDNSVMDNFFGLLKQEIWGLFPCEYRLKNDTLTKSPSNNFA